MAKRMAGSPTLSSMSRALTVSSKAFVASDCSGVRRGEGMFLTATDRGLRIEHSQRCHRPDFFLVDLVGLFGGLPLGLTGLILCLRRALRHHVNGALKAR